MYLILFSVYFRKVCFMRKIVKIGDEIIIELYLDFVLAHNKLYEDTFYSSIELNKKYISFVSFIVTVLCYVIWIYSKDYYYLLLLL